MKVIGILFIVVGISAILIGFATPHFLKEVDVATLKEYMQVAFIVVGFLMSGAGIFFILNKEG